jgi:hypothetical protein
MVPTRKMKQDKYRSPSLCDLVFLLQRRFSSIEVTHDERRSMVTLVSFSRVSCKPPILCVGCNTLSTTSIIKICCFWSARHRLTDSNSTSSIIDVVSRDKCLVRGSGFQVMLTQRLARKDAYVVSRAFCWCPAYRTCGLPGTRQLLVTSFHVGRPLRPPASTCAVPPDRCSPLTKHRGSWVFPLIRV